MTEIDLVCENCGKDFKRYKPEYKRSQKLGRKVFCGLSCSRVRLNRENKLGKNPQNLKQGKEIDKFSPFRWFMSRCRQRKHPTDLTIDMLANLWKQQNGICPLTGWNLLLPRDTLGFRQRDEINRASLDRIDSSKGYVQGNVRFISLIANYAKNIFNDEDLIEFCQAVTIHCGSCVV